MWSQTRTWYILIALCTFFTSPTPAFFIEEEDAGSPCTGISCGLLNLNPLPTVSDGLWDSWYVRWSRERKLETIKDVQALCGWHWLNFFFFFFELIFFELIFFELLRLCFPPRLRRLPNQDLPQAWPLSTQRIPASSKVEKCWEDLKSFRNSFLRCCKEALAAPALDGLGGCAWLGESLFLSACYKTLCSQATQVVRVESSLNQVESILKYNELYKWMRFFSWSQSLARLEGPFVANISPPVTFPSEKNCPYGTIPFLGSYMVHLWARKNDSLTSPAPTLSL